MADTAITTWMNWARALNDRDWEAWDQLIAPQYTQVSYSADSQEMAIDKPKLRRIHESLAANGFTVDVLSVSAVGTMIATAFALVGPEGERIAEVAILRVDSEGRLLRAYDFTSGSTVVASSSSRGAA